MRDDTSGLGSSRRPSVTVMIAVPRSSKPRRRQEGGEAYGPAEPDEEEDLEDEEDLEEEAPGSPEEEDNRRIVIEAAKALRGESQNPEEAINEFLEVYGRERLQELKRFVAEEEEAPPGMPPEGEAPPEGMKKGGEYDSYADGGRLVEGPGRGLEDRISARAGDQPVLLSDGEFVIPADVVSHLGDGSTRAGVRALEAMMARARHSRTGSKEQAKGLNLKKVLPV